MDSTVTTKLINNPNRYPLRRPSISLFFLLLILLINASSFITADKVEEQVCKEQDQTCHAKHGLSVDELQGLVDESKGLNYGDAMEIPNDDDDDDYDDDDYEDDDDDDDEYLKEEENDEYIDYDGDDLCKNEHDMCDNWAEAGECNANPGYMLKSCQRSCKTCER